MTTPPSSLFRRSIDLLTIAHLRQRRRLHRGHHFPGLPAKHRKALKTVGLRVEAHALSGLPIDLLRLGRKDNLDPFVAEELPEGLRDIGSYFAVCRLEMKSSTGFKSLGAVGKCPTPSLMITVTRPPSSL
jgi:hypothetical protein